MKAKRWDLALYDPGVIGLADQHFEPGSGTESIGAQE
jgi:hypothetical protein